MKKHVVSLFAGLACCGVFGTELTSTNYVSSGLVGHWDGLENAGRGLHDATTNYWVDLTGKTGDFEVQTTVAGFTDNGLRKTANGFMASNGVVRVGIQTIEVVVSGAPASGWVNTLILRKQQTVSFNNSVGAVGGRRKYFFDDGHNGWVTESKPAQETICVFYDVTEWNSWAVATGFLQNGVQPAGESATDWWGYPDLGGMCIGGRATYASGGDFSTKGYTIHAIRLYNRKITNAEANYNACVDRIRFFGGSEDDLPYTFQNGVPRLQMNAAAGAGGAVQTGWVTDDSPLSARASSGWRDLGFSTTYVFRAEPLPGWHFVDWTGDFADIRIPSADSSILILPSIRSVEARANFEPDDSFAGYVTNGLICRLDGLENAGVGLLDDTTNVWKDLSETAGDFHVIPTVASFNGRALHKNAKGVMATNAVRRTDILTMEAVVSDVPSANAWMNLFFVDANQTLSVNNNFASANGQRQYFVDDNHLAWNTDEKPAPFTFAATYTRSSNKAVGEMLTVNGAPPATGTAAKQYWDTDDAVGMSVGGRTGTRNKNRGDFNTTGFSVNAARLYNRRLGEGELAYNAALDQVRFFGASTNAMPYRLTAEGGVECVLRAWTTGLGGRISIVDAGEPDVCVERTWRAFGTSDSAMFTAKAAEGWKFLYWRGDVGAITSGTTNDLVIGVSSARGAALEAVFTSTGEYAKDGLIGFWDAIENAGYGRHAMIPRTWTDLTGRTGDFMVNPLPGEFSEDALQHVRVGRSARRARRSGIRTIEVVLSGLQHNNKWVMPVFVSTNQCPTFKDTSATGVRQYFFDYNQTGFETADMPTNMTLTVTYLSDEKTANTCYVNGVEAGGAAYVNWWGDLTEGNQMVMSGRSDTATEAKTLDYRIHAVRFYDRELTEAEIERNAREDAIRFFGAPRKNGIMVIVR